MVGQGACIVPIVGSRVGICGRFGTGYISVGDLEVRVHITEGRVCTTIVIPHHQ